MTQAAVMTEPPRAAGKMTIADAIEVIERCGLTDSWHLGEAAMQIFQTANVAPGERRARLNKASELLERWLDDPLGVAVTSVGHDYAMPNTSAIIAMFGIKGNAAIALTYLIEAAKGAEHIDMEPEVRKAHSAIMAEIDQ